MRSIIRASLRFRLLVAALAVGLLGIGVVQLRDAPVDVLPEFTPPYAEIQTEALGLSAEEVEELITVPLEADLLNGIEGVEVIRSQSLPSLSSIVLVFAPGTDVYRARQLVQERLIQAHALPNVSKPPTLLQPLSSSSRVMMIGLTSDRLTPIEKSVLARWTIRPRLMGVEGVANVAVWGMRDQQLQVQVDPATLRDRDVTLNQVIATAGNAQAVSPLTFLEASTPGTGGFIETPQQRLQVRNVLEQLADPAELAGVPVEGTGGRLRLSDVADVTIDHQPLIGDAVVDGGEGLLLVVEKFPSADTREVTAGVEDALEKLRPGLTGLQTDTSVFRPATFIEDATSNLTLAILLGGGLLVLALAALMAQWRTLVVAVVTIPLSLVAAALALVALGETINALSFAGLAVAALIVVDEGVTGADAVARRMRERRASGSGRSPAAVVLDATAEIRGPLVFGTLIALLSVLPIAVMAGRPGAFFGPLVLAYAVAVVAAMLVAATVAPALAAMLFAVGTPQAREAGLLRSARRRYDAVLAAAIARPGRVFLTAGAVLLAGLVALPFMGSSVVPTFKDRDVLVRLDAEPGTSNPSMTRSVTTLSRELRSLPGVDNVGAHVGRAVTGDQIVDVNSGEVWVSVASDADYTDTVDNIRDSVAGLDGVESEVLTHSAQAIRNVGALEAGDNGATGDGLSLLTGADDPLVVRVYGPNTDRLRAEADKVRELVAGVDGVVDPRVAQPVEQPSLEIEVALARAQELGVSPGAVRRSESALLQGIQVGSVFEGQKVFDVLVRGVPSTRDSVASVRDLLIDRPGGGHVRLGQVADVREVPTAIAVQREAVSRYLDVTARLDGRSASAVGDDITVRLEQAAFPLEYHAEVLERTTGDEIGATRIVAFAAGAALAAFLLLQAAFRSWALALAVVAALPVALSGGALAALVDGAELRLGALAGLLALLALAVRIAILLVRRFEDGRAGGAEPGVALVREGASERFGPIATTGAASALLVLPAVVLGARPGLEIVHPMAVVVIGGLLTTLPACLLLIPALYLRFGGGGRTEMEGAAPVVRQWPGFAPEEEPGPAAPANGPRVEPPVREEPNGGVPAGGPEGRP